jgi:hypothetical protein
MKALQLYISEGIKLNANSKVNSLRDLSDVDYEFVSNTLYFNTSKEEKKYDNEVKKRKAENNINALKKAKLAHELLRYWYLCITNGWISGAKELRNEFVNRGSFEEDELDAYILSKYNKKKGFLDTMKNFEAYLDSVHVKYDKH